MFFFENHLENETGGPNPDFYFLKKALSGKRKWSAAQFQYMSIVLNFAYSKNKLYKTLVY